MNAYRASSLIEINTLARSARVKMVQECRRPDMDLIRVVGHANFLDQLKHATLQAHLEIITESPKKKKPQKVKTTTREVTCEHVEHQDADDMAMAFESISYSSPRPESAVHVVACDESDDDDTSSESSESDDGEPLERYKASPSDLVQRSKPIAIPQARVSVAAVEVC